MPFTLLAHQLPVLPVKLGLRERAAGTALVLGSVAPDLEYVFVEPPTRGAFGHSLVGQLVLVPLCLAVVWLVGRLDLGAVVAARLGPRAAFLDGLATGTRRPGGLRTALWGVIVGAFSHLGLDALTHERPGGLLPEGALPILGHLPTVTTVAQLVATGIGAPAALWMLWRILGERQRQQREAVAARVHEAPRPVGAALLIAAALVGAAVALVHGAPVIRHPIYYFNSPRVYLAGYLIFATVTGAATGVFVAALGLRAGDPALIGYRATTPTGQ